MNGGNTTMIQPVGGDEYEIHRGPITVRTLPECDCDLCDDMGRTMTLHAKSAARLGFEKCRAMNINPFTIGKMYQVPCVANPPWASSGKWLPIIGPLHEDTEIVRFKHDHWHIDWRFVSESFFRSTVRTTLSHNPHALVLSPRLIEGFNFKITARRMRCKREMPEFPMIAPWLEELENAFEQSRLSRDLICPHRGMPLAGCPVKNGLAVCPGHGLQWNVETGELVKRAL